MMPCKRCGPFDSNGLLRKGLKRRGKTEYDIAALLQTRRYRCQDCGVDVTLKIASDGQHWDEYGEPEAETNAPKKSLWDRLK